MTLSIDAEYSPPFIVEIFREAPPIHKTTSITVPEQTSTRTRTIRTRRAENLSFNGAHEQPRVCAA